MVSTITRAITLSQAGPPPTEFQIFRRGANSTTKGIFNFDREAARQVMAAYALGAVDLPIDLEHDSLSAERRAQRADAGDARGWFKLALRPDGSLWATDVRWTPDGVRRLTERTQRYISPAFAVDGDRPSRLVNCALCAHPATHGAPALVAASRTEVLSARVTPAARAALYLLAAKRKQTISAVLLTALDTITDAANTAPTRDQLATLKAVTAALGLPQDADGESIKSALAALLEAIPPPETNPNPIAGVADAPPPTRLSREIAARGMTQREFERRKAELKTQMRRTHHSNPKAK